MLKTEMNKLVEYVKETLPKIADIDDRHLQTCQRTADYFGLWETTVKSKDGKAKEEHFPLWLSFVVQGIGRDMELLT